MTMFKVTPRAPRVRALATTSLAVALCLGGALSAQSATVIPTPIEIGAGRSVPIGDTSRISQVTVANPEVADVIVISERDVVLNGKAPGETDVILWGVDTPRRHFRVTVRSSAARRQVLLGVKFAEVRKDALRAIGTSLRARDNAGRTRVGAGEFRTDENINDDGSVTLDGARYLTVLSTFGSRELLGLLDAEERRGNARFLAEPNLMAANREEASFLAGGEVPIPIVQGGAAGTPAFVTIQFREFGVRLTFRGEVLSDSLLKLTVKPEVSSLDYSNAVTIAGYQVPAIRARRVESTVDVLTDRSLIISGLFSEERERVKTGIPLLSNIPILGDLLSSQRWLRNESELIVVVTPIVIDPNNPREADLLRLTPPTTLPAREALEGRLTPPAATARPGGTP
ncbi:MAG: pilus assembly protein N-terminal domain-containing protein [Gemmatimonadaceae bacterium]|nr:pilus assembly protein N-terminal domain-containing protein [Gemmatimonadaceae bacterium]